MTTDLPEEDWHPADHLDALAVSALRWWLWAVQLTAKRLHEGLGPARQIDARFFILALAQFRTEIVKISIPNVAAAVQDEVKSAVKQFDAAVPGVTDARHVLMHLDQYAAGTGNAQKLEQATASAGALSTKYVTGTGYNPATNTVRVGSEDWPEAPHYELDLATKAAGDLYLALTVALAAAPAASMDQ